MDGDIFAIRGAIAPVVNTRDGVFKATSELLTAILSRNRLDVESVVLAFFTVTADLNAAFPAAAARAAGWNSVPMMCALEIPVEGALPACVRVLLLCRRPETDRAALCPQRPQRRHCLAGRLAAARRRRLHHQRPSRHSAAPARPVHVYLGEAAVLRPDLACADTNVEEADEAGGSAE
ncbi:MAG: chorismate mutase [Bacillota bacterium]|nr:chorismate mutase [Bacillota bacterium]